MYRIPQNCVRIPFVTRKLYSCTIKIPVSMSAYSKCKFKLANKYLYLENGKSEAHQPREYLPKLVLHTASPRTNNYSCWQALKISKIFTRTSGGDLTEQCSII